MAGLFTDQVITGSLSLDGPVEELVDVHSVTQRVDALGKALGSPRTVALRAGGGHERIADYSCLPKTNGNKDFTQYKPVEIWADDAKGKIQALFHTYRQNNARIFGRAGTRTRSTQYEVCAVGGVDSDGARTRRAGVGITYADYRNTFKIGQVWKEGRTPAEYNLSMSFKVPVKGVKIGGGISQNPSEKLMGSVGTPFDTAVDDYSRNGVNAWWQDSCIGSWHGCRFMNGSKDYHGALAHGLYEFAPEHADAALYGFRYSAFRSAS